MELVGNRKETLMSNDFVKQLEASLYEMLPLVKALDIKLEEARPGYVVSSMSRTPIVVNHIDAFHAGALYTFAETAAGAVIAASFDLGKITLINKRGEINYQKLVKEKVICKAAIPQGAIEVLTKEVMHSGKAVFPYTVVLELPGGEPACEVTFDFYMYRNRE
ncbi:Acyl-coenzyme A thioesterase PaaI, contains HGG motif [Desulfatibacillum alkenivorans DSM 16219]|jgi:acyl-coenzyme A thioesterase PaaI-like protein|uniref:Acyl-coenzyme A thioesterase PaaI, contains HGG motif n=2 Tax=Desulfatibacillum alkenivorans TaxID=259354 RepID=A0A1M6UQZ7_9BACT|nr:Acyl-coenzyme A thioesterase PaaI, contains HGG motif [Desulfatibacillum alkenivorans DSM 16219]